MIHRLRLASGLILFVFVASHLVNHALGIGSLRAMAAGLKVFEVAWTNTPALTLLGSAAAVHVGIALWSVFRRRHLRMPGWEWAQIALGLVIPLLLIEHVLGTVVAFKLFGVRPDYTFVQYVYWVATPWRGVLQAALLLVAWVHGCIGLHFWLRTRPWYGRAVPVLYALALLVPALSLAGFVASGIEVQRLAANEAWVAALLDRARVSDAAAVFVARGTALGQAAFIGLVAAAFGGRWLRLALWRRRRVPRLTYPDGRMVEVHPGATVLETSRAAGIPHASVCGGRGRCSTCRVHVGAGAEHLPPPTPAEQKVLARIGAPPTVRLACQIRPTAGLAVTPLLPPFAGPEEGFRQPGYRAGQEREIAILFADLRGFTRLADTRLPFDVVFLLNRYFECMGAAVEGVGGRIDKFIGDGVMALFGIERGPEDGSRRALAAARAMAGALAELNRALAVDLPEPLRMGIGIHLGHAIVGEMGYGRAKALTAIGDAVNTASRLEGLTKDLDVQLVVSDDLAARAGIDLTGFPAREVAVRGKRRPLTVRAVASALDLPVGG